MLETISSWSAAKRPAVIEFFSVIPGFEFAAENNLAETWLDLTATADKSSQRRAALEILSFAESLKLDAERIRKLALAYRDTGNYSRSLATLKRTKMAGPQDSDMLLEIAARAARGDQQPVALESLALAESLAPDPERILKLAMAYRDIGGYSRSLAVLKRMKMRGPKDADMLLDMAARAARSGQRPAALESLAFAETLSLDPERRRRLAVAYWDLGGHSRSLALLKRAGLKGPKDADMLLDLAVRAQRDRQRQVALASLAFAESMSLEPESMRSLALGYRAMGESRSATRVRRRMGDEAGLELDQAEASAASGDGNSARTHLARVRDLSLVNEEARRLVLIYQGLREYAPALGVANRRVLARPEDARWRNDRGVLHALMGDQKEAIADWNSAIALNPDSLAPYLSLGSLYASMNRRKEALDLYQRAISRRRVTEDDGVLRQILAERQKLLAAQLHARD